MRSLLPVLVMLLAVTGTTLFAQHDHGAVNSDVIDRGKNPELVPDSTAYRLFLLTAGQGSKATTEKRLKQKGILQPIGLSDEEVEVVEGILDQFKDDYTKMVSEYNASVIEANNRGESPDLRTFLERRDFLVQQTRDLLTSSLSNEAMSRFDSHVQAEKRHMTVSKEIQ